MTLHGRRHRFQLGPRKLAIGREFAAPLGFVAVSFPTHSWHSAQSAFARAATHRILNLSCAVSSAEEVAPKELSTVASQEAPGTPLCRKIKLGFYGGHGRSNRGAYAELNARVGLGWRVVWI